MLDRVISGFQTGADQVGIRAARAHGLPTGGAMPLGFLTERPDGRGDEGHPDYAEPFGAVELPTDSYPERTRRNVVDSDGTPPAVRRGSPRVAMGMSVEGCERQVQVGWPPRSGGSHRTTVHVSRGRE